MAKKAAEKNLGDIEAGRSAVAHKNIAGAGVEDRGDVEGANGAGISDMQGARGYTIRSQGQ